MTLDEAREHLKIFLPGYWEKKTGHKLDNAFKRSPYYLHGAARNWGHLIWHGIPSHAPETNQITKEEREALRVWIRYHIGPVKGTPPCLNF